MSGIKASHNTAASRVALGVLSAIALNAEGRAPEWIMLLPLPADGKITTVDGRGPYRVADPRRLIHDSMSPNGVTLPLVVDENHSTDLAAPEGRPAPARGWIAKMEMRGDGIWGQVDWNESGRALLGDKSYRGISPVFMHDGDNNVVVILRASLTNKPNLRGMAALHQENDMELLAQMRSILGLGNDATAEAVCAKVKEMKGGTSMQAVAVAAGLTEAATSDAVLNAVKALKSAPTLAAALAPIAKAVGLAESADAAAIIAAVTTLAAQGDGKAIAALQAELTTVTTSLNALKSDGAKTRATTYVDGEIAKGRVGVKPMRDHYIARHAANSEGAAAVEKEIGALPILGGKSHASDTPPEIKDGKVVLNADQKNICKLLGITEDDYAKKLAAEAAQSAAA